MSNHFISRREKIRRRLKKEGFSAFLVTAKENVFYLTGFRGSDSYLLLTLRGDVLLTDTRFETQLKEDCPGLDSLVRRPDKTSMMEELVKRLKAEKFSSIAFEGGNVSWSFVEKFRQEAPSITPHAVENFVETLRQVKDAQEIALIRRALKINEKAFCIVRDANFSSLSERDVQCLLDTTMRKLGAEGEAFPSIIAAGARAALPHAIPTDTKVASHNLLLIDWGCYLDHYCCDLTRTLLSRKPSKKLQTVYNTVLKAQLAAIAAIRPGIATKDIDAVARGVISDAGFGKYFSHGTGHGFGLKVHEQPRLGQRSNETLEAGMIITVEPGIYLPNLLGVRIEDDVLVTKNGAEVLSNLEKDMESMMVL